MTRCDGDANFDFGDQTDQSLLNQMPILWEHKRISFQPNTRHKSSNIEFERRAFNRTVRQHSKSISAIKLDNSFSKDFRNRQLPFETRVRKRRRQRRQSTVDRAFDICAPHWLAAYAEAGVPNGVRMFYSVRHAYATDMANKGMELPDSLARKYGREGIQASGH